MTTNYFKLWAPKTRATTFVFFDETNASSIATAYNRASELQTKLGGRLAVCYQPRLPGAWSSTPAVGEPS